MIDVPKHKIDTAVKLYNSGWSIKRIKPILGKSHHPTVKKILENNGVRIRAKLEQHKISVSTPEHKNKLREINLGRIHSEETKLKMKINKGKFMSKSFLIKNYSHRKLSCPKIAKMVGCCRDTVENYLRFYNIPSNKFSDYCGYWKNRKNPELTKRNLLNNPAKRPEVRAKLSKIWRENPKFQANHNQRRNKRTFIELEMIRLLSILGYQEDKDYLFNKFIKTNNNFRFPDFLFKDKNLIIEVDGKYWHRDKDKEQIRDSELNDIGLRVYHFEGSKINESLIPELKEILK